MAYDRYDTRGDRSRLSNDRFADRDRMRGDNYGRSSGENRGFFERAGDEIASWFGDDDADRRRDRDRRMDERGYGEQRYSRDRDEQWRDRGRSWEGGDGARDRDSDRDFRGERGLFGGRGSYRGTSGDSGVAGGFSAGRDQGYRPMTGDYGRSEGYFTPDGYQEQTAGSISGSSPMDPHYHSWRRRQMDELDRDYDDYRRENQARFEDDFSSWRQKRGEKRGLLGQIREHMEVVGNDDEHVGTVDRVAGDRVILTKSDPDSGGVHHSLSCSDIDRVEDNRVILDCSSDQARQRWRDESRNRALFEREDQGEMGPRILDRSFEGTYR
jgi:hypothetical protein